MRFLPHALAALAIVAAVWFIRDSGVKAERAAEVAREAVAERKWNDRIDALENTMLLAVGGADQKVADEIAKIDLTERTIIRPRLEREIRVETRFTDPGGLSVGLLDAINAARAETGCATTVDGGVTCPVSKPVGSD